MNMDVDSEMDINMEVYINICIHVPGKVVCCTLEREDVRTL
jgi:hypothetical protein